MVQKFIEKHRGHTWFSISIDGTKEKHNVSRIKKDGSGSYDDVVKNVPLWLKQFPNAANKATFSHNDLPYLKESVLHLWDLGIKHVMANVVYEDVWQDGDDLIYENQLKELADYIIDHNWKNQSSAECNVCQEGKGCGWCVAYNYEMSTNDTIFERNQAICKMHKANARANKYFWRRFEETTGRTSQMTIIKSSAPNAEYLKFINFITSDHVTPHCGYQVAKKDVHELSYDTLQKGIRFCKRK